ncbi:MAG: tautomerase family protein [Gimesia sp.]|mgnify:FL=1|jgi:phenylpyruvate tautomerase PptA (4-oxalocrotonate tautomerase family)|nr:tautomerase family protein [Gimesia sp.]
MPLVRIDIPDHLDVGLESRIGDLVYVAMLECLKVPADDKFQILSRHSAEQIVKPQSYLGIEYTDELLVIQITLNEGRKTDVKKSFYAKVADLLSGELNLRRENLLISLVEVNKENWSFGNGEMQYGPG